MGVVGLVCEFCLGNVCMCVAFDVRLSLVRREKSHKEDVRMMNIEAAKAVADAIRTSLGPRGADKMVRSVCAVCNTKAGTVWGGPCVLGGGVEAVLVLASR